MRNLWAHRLLGGYALPDLPLGSQDYAADQRNIIPCETADPSAWFALKHAIKNFQLHADIFIP